MKRILAAAALVAMTTAQAEEIKFGDLNYFVKQGQFNLTADMNNVTENTNAGGAKIENEGYILASTLTYGITEELNAFIGLNYFWDFETHVNGGPSLDTAGIKFPTLGANYRVMKQADKGFNLDVGAVARLNLQDAEVSDSADDEGNTLAPEYSNFAQTRNSVELNVRAGQKWNEANEWYALAGIVNHTSGEYEFAGSGEKVDVDSSMDFKLGAFYQYRPVNEFMYTFGVVATQYGEVEYKDDAGKEKADSHIDYQFIFAAKYLITDTFIVKFNYLQDRRSDFDLGDAEVNRRRSKQWGLGVDWLF
jgi:hypothetical protein